MNQTFRAAISIILSSGFFMGTLLVIVHYQDVLGLWFWPLLISQTLVSSFVPYWLDHLLQVDDS